MRPQSKPWEVPATFSVADVGRTFVNFLETASIDSLVKGKVKYRDETLELYSSALDAINLHKRPEQLSYNRDFLSPIDMIEAVVAHHITAPLLRARLETKHEVFYSISKYMEKISSLPQPPVVFRGDEEAYADYMQSPQVSDAWVKYCMLSSAMREFYSLSSTLSCVRANQFDPSTINLCDSSTCSQNISAGRCQSWHQGDPLMDCVFASMVRRLGLAEP